MKNFCLITLFICFSGLPVWGGGTSEKAVYDLIERVTPGYASQYRLEMIQAENGSDVYEVGRELSCGETMRSPWQLLSTGI